MDDLLVAALKSFVIPEILTAVRAHRNATGTEPTSEQILAALDLSVDRVKTQGQAYLDATRGHMPAGDTPATHG